MSTNGRDRFLSVTTGKGAEYAGWQEPLPALVARLQAHVAGIRGRLEQPTREVSIWPSAVAGRYTFKPDPLVIDVDVEQTNAGTQPVNVVVPSGKTVNVRLIFPGPGVFVGRWLKATLSMRLFNPLMRGDQVTWIPVVSNVGAALQDAGPDGPPYTTRFSVFPLQPVTPPIEVLATGAIRPPALNYAWNMQDTRSGRWYADRPLSSAMMLPGSWTGDSPPGVSVMLRDGDLFDLKAPWVFERDGQANFAFTPITDLYQFASSIPGNAAPMNLPFDDREGGVRDQGVLLQVEMHGFRFETMQDAVHAGALTQVFDDDSNGSPLPPGTSRMARKGM